MDFPRRSPRRLALSVLSASLLLAACAATPPADRSVTIKRDSFGVPHIYAQNTYGLFYGYGYAVATDRLYQMEIAKRSGWGTVAEVLGPDYLELDKVTHGSFDPESIRRQLTALPAEDRAIFEGYAAGFTQRVRDVKAQAATLMPREFIANGFEPSEWQPEDIAMVWVGLILNRFFAGTAEMANLNLLETLRAAEGPVRGEQLYRQLRWLNDPTAPTIIPQQAASKAQAQMPAALQALSPQAARDYLHRQSIALGPAVANGTPTASNAWVLGPAKTLHGHAVLYNGPQQGWYTPSITYSVGLHGAGYDLTGSTAVALPAILFGTNGRIAWGSTVGSLDTNDVYQLRLKDGDPHSYWYQGAWRPMEHKQVRIKVRGQDDVLLDVYRSVQGFVSTWDARNNTAYANRRSWEGREIETLLGWAQAAKARNWDEFMAQAARVSASITWFYADTERNIGAAALGRLPQRPAGQPVQFPAVGDGSMEWQGFLSFEHNPKVINPEQGYVASWNNKAFAGLLADSSNFSYVDRVQELLAPLQAKQRLSDEEIWAVDQMGARSDLNARYFAPLIQQAAALPRASALAREAAAQLRGWDYKLHLDEDGRHYRGSAPAVMQAWMKAAVPVFLKGRLPESVYASYEKGLYPGVDDPRSAQPAAAAKLIWNAIQGPRSGVPQTIDFLQGRPAREWVLDALEQAARSLQGEQGAQAAKWRAPAVPMLFAARNAIGVPWGDPAHQRRVWPYLNTGSESFQVVLDPQGVRMCSVAAPGQSGFVDPQGKADPHHSDQLELFSRFGCKPDAVGAQAIEKAAVDTLTLRY